MKKLTLLLLIFCSYIVSCTGDVDRSIQLNVSQTVQIPVEMVTITVRISETGNDPEAVERRGYEKLASVVQLLRENGYTDDDLEITAGELHSNFYRNENQVQFTSVIVFELTDTDLIDTFRRGITEAGGTSFSVSDYGNPDETRIYDEAYQNAIDAARERADKLLTNQGVKAGSILSVQENIHEIIEHSANVTMSMQDQSQFRAEMEPVDPMFNKEYYTKSIQFNIVFELIRN